MRVEVSAKFASMPISTSVHTSTVNFVSAIWEMFHLIRSICVTKGLLWSHPGHMAHNRARKPRCDPVIQM